MRRYFVPLTYAALYISTIFLANWAVKHYGPVSVGFGLVAPAGVYFAGVAFIIRDLLQITSPRPVLWVLAAIAIGSVASYTTGTGKIAVASATAFFVSELLDFFVFSAVRERGFSAAVVLSNIVGALVDSYIFLSVAFGSLAFFWGQVVGKLWITGLFAIVYLLARQTLVTVRRS
jgi:queuosine precursor transporter